MSAISDKLPSVHALDGRYIIKSRFRCKLFFFALDQIGQYVVRIENRLIFCKVLGEVIYYETLKYTQ